MTEASATGLPITETVPRTLLRMLASAACSPPNPARLMPRPAISSPRFNVLNGFIESEWCCLLAKGESSICHPLDWLPVRMGSRQSP
ncbi:MAG: hypothetical protein RAK19_05640 [Synechococcus sp. SP1 MAG]|nr:hypothetical protein [Synechococcus sp. SP1 MAG]